MTTAWAVLKAVFNLVVVAAVIYYFIYDPVRSACLLLLLLVGKPSCDCRHQVNSTVEQLIETLRRR